MSPPNPSPTRRGGLAFGSILVLAMASANNVYNAHQLSPSWGMDLAFFHQLVASAARGGPWGSPLLLEPTGFFEMVHTHLILPAIILVYRLLPTQHTLLISSSLMAAVAIWPLGRLAQAVAGRHAVLPLVLGLGCCGAFLGTCTSDFRPSNLFLPGILGIWAAVWRKERAWPWALLALAGRQEAVYLIGLSGLSLLIFPWGPHHRFRRRAAFGLCAIAALAFLFFYCMKPNFFYYIDLRHWPQAPPPLSPDHAADRLGHVKRLLYSGLPLGVLSPAPLLAAAPLLWEMVGTHREWGPVQGPASHYPAFWLPFLLPAAIVGAHRLARLPGIYLLSFGLALAWPRPGWRVGPIEARTLLPHISPDDRVAADYALIHAVAGREVLWNTAQLRMSPEERPRGWSAPWPIPLSDLDQILLSTGDPLEAKLIAADWVRVQDAGNFERWVSPNHQR